MLSGSDPFLNLSAQNRSDVGIDPGSAGAPWQLAQMRAYRASPRRNAAALTIWLGLEPQK